MQADKAFRILPILALALFVVTWLGQAPRAFSYQQNSKSGASSEESTPTSNPSTANLADFAWLEGRWKGEWGPRIAEQVWLSPKAGVMEGMFRVLESDKTLVIEFFTLVQKPDGITFYFRHFTPSLAPWEKSDATVLNLASIDAKKSVFENSVNGMPKTATWTRVDPDTYLYHAQLVPETGDRQEIEITYKRQPALGSATNGGNAAHPKKP
jgi:hypothetical protein